MKCPECGSPEIIFEPYDFGTDPCTGYHDCGEGARCINCAFSSTDINEFSEEESMDEIQTEQTTSAADQARVLIYNMQQHEEQKIALIASLRAERVRIDEALVALGAKRNHRKAESKKRGRPTGSRNKVAPIGGEAA